VSPWVTMTDIALDPACDLVLERLIDAPVARVWAAWVDPASLEQWWCPKPYHATDWALDLEPGGAFAFVVRSPEGDGSPYVGCVLEVEAPHRIVWTTAMRSGYRPNALTSDVPPFTCVVTFEAVGQSTRYRAVARHANAAGARTHAEMGFHEGWGAALDQLVALVTG
jgi:uncharacterized protein YndB with AHSA1/START domain